MRSKPMEGGILMLEKFPLKATLIVLLFLIPFNLFAQSNWKVIFTGTTRYVLTDEKWESLMKCTHHRMEITLNFKGRDHKYVVVPFWIFTAVVDGGEEKHPYIFDSELWKEGYDVTIVGRDGYTVTFNTSEIPFDSIYIAGFVDGRRIEGSPPLRIVGRISKKLWVMNPIEVEFDVPGKGKEEGKEFEFELSVNGKVHKFTIEELEKSGCYVEGCGGYKTSAGSVRKGYYGGVKLLDLVRRYTEISEDEMVRITAMDGYVMDYSMKQFLEQEDGVWILAFKKDGEYLPVDPGYIRIMKVGRNCPIIDGHSSVRMVKRIEILRRKYRDFALRLEGYMNFTLNRQDLMSGLSCHGVKVRYKEKDGVVHEYYGIPLWRFLAYSDDPKYAPHKQDPSIPSYNEKFASEGYRIVVIAKDGFRITLDSRYLNKNDNVILAMFKDGKELSGDEWPLTLVWNMDSGKIPGMKKVKGVEIVRIIVK